MKRLVMAVALLATSATSNASNDWNYRESGDTFTSAKYYEITIGDIEWAGSGSLDNKEYFTFGLKCYLTERERTLRFVTFSFGTPFAYYGELIHFRVKIGDINRKYRGFMYDNSMEHGYAELSAAEFVELKDALLTGQKIHYRVDPLGKGEQKGTVLTHNDPKEAIEQLLPNCNV